jgi:hypothetical protein
MVAGPNPGIAPDTSRGQVKSRASGDLANCAFVISLIGGVSAHRWRAGRVVGVYEIHDTRPSTQTVADVPGNRHDPG